MSSPKLLLPPVRKQQLTKWQVVKCSCCNGHVIPSSLITNQKEESQQEQIFVVGIDISAWDKIITRERKKPYTPKPRPLGSIGGNSGKGFGLKRT